MYLEHLAHENILARVEGDQIRVKRPGGLTDEHRAWIRANKAQIRAELISQQEQILNEAIEEKAALLEYDASVDRTTAEATARRMARAFRYRLTDDPGQWRVMVSMDEALDLQGAIASVVHKFGAHRVIEVTTPEARALLFIEHPAGRVAGLRRMGHSIITRRDKVQKSGRYVRKHGGKRQ